MDENENIGACGLNCADCPAFLARKNNDERLRQETAAQWQLMYDFPFMAEDINCSGCMKDGDKIGHCYTCKIRKCALEHQKVNCGCCEDFPCQQISDFFETLPADLEKENRKRLKS